MFVLAVAFNPSKEISFHEEAGLPAAPTKKRGTRVFRRTGACLLDRSAVTFVAVRRFAAVGAALMFAGGWLALAPTTPADPPCHDGAVIPAPTDERGDAYLICRGGNWVHVVPYFDPNSADGYGPNQELPPLCVRFPGQFPCPT